MIKLTDKIKEEIEALIPPTVFFFIALHLVAFVRVLMLEGTGIPLATSATVTIAALILAKAVLIADLLPFINRFPERPLAYNVAWNTALYYLIAMLLHYLEELVGFWRKAGGLIAGNEKMLAEIVWPHFWAIQIFLLAMILMYCTMHEFARVIGGENVRRMFFGPLDKTLAP